MSTKRCIYCDTEKPSENFTNNPFGGTKNLICVTCRTKAPTKTTKKKSIPSKPKDPKPKEPKPISKFKTFVCGICNHRRNTVRLAVELRNCKFCKNCIVGENTSANQASDPVVPHFKVAQPLPRFKIPLTRISVPLLPLPEKTIQKIAEKPIIVTIRTCNGCLKFREINCLIKDPDITGPNERYYCKTCAIDYGL